MIHTFGDGAIAQISSAYIAGLLTVLTPCIYPLIPVTLSLFGVTAQLSRFKAFLLSSSYVAGICVTYTILGLVSAKAKVLFGSALGNIWFAAPLALLFFALALYSIEVITFSGVSRVQNSFSKIGGKGLGGAFFMGAASGFVAAPCAGPILAGILAMAAQSGDSTWAGALLFTYALGFGSIFILLGTFSGLSRLLPRPGAWMNSVKFVTASALLAVSIFLVRPFLPFLQNISFLGLYGGLLIVPALLLAKTAYQRNNTGLKITAAALGAIAVLQLPIPGITSTGIQGATTSPLSQTGSPPNEITKGGLKWHTSIDAGIAAAPNKYPIIMVDFFAEWCAACKELVAITFPDPAVSKILRDLTLVKLDFTTIDDPQQAILDRYSVLGLPAILFMRPDGSEIPNSRVNGFLNPSEFQKHLLKVINIEHSTAVDTENNDQS